MPPHFSKGSSHKENVFVLMIWLTLGKEANNIENQLLDVDRPQIFINEKEIKNLVLASTPEGCFINIITR